MSWYHPQSLLDKIFEGGIIIKGVTGALEFIAGLLLFFVKPAQVHDLIVAVTQKELIEDPNDFVANTLLNWTHTLGGMNFHFLIAYLWIHATVKLIAVIGILRNQMWAYPFSLITLGLLMLYQLYHIFFVQVSVGMILLTVFDVFILWLIWREYTTVRRIKAAPDD
jgi:uncharacterized membrane protein